MPRDTDDEIAEARWEARQAARRSRCQCGPDLPGVCPGPASCPYSGVADDEPEEPDGEGDE